MTYGAIEANATEASASDAGALVRAVRNGPRLDVTINRPDKRNALSQPALTLLKDIFESHAENPAIKLAVLTGAGEKSFAAGGDLVELASVRTIAEAEGMSRHSRAALDAVRRFPVPVIAMLNGDALGGGAELAVACDFRIAAPHARIGFVQGRLGISTAWGGGIDLAALVGPSRALLYLSRSDLFNAHDAKAAGLVDEIAGPGESLADAVGRFAAPMLGQVRQSLTAFKALVGAHRRGVSRAEMEDLETTRFAQAWCHEDHWALVNAVLPQRPR